MTQEALKLALETLETELSIDWTNNDEFNASAEKMHKAIAAIKQALLQPEQFCDANCVWTDHHPDCKLAQPEQEPVGYWKEHAQGLQRDYDLLLADYEKLAQRTWVGLTEEDFSAINQSCLTKLQAAISAEQILMGKNT